jgi:hypothetical protein
MKKLLLISLVLLVVIACTSCNLFKNPFTFENLSSYTVHVWPNGQAWIEFYLAPGQSFSVENYGNYDSIRYYYSPSDKVYPDDSGYNTIIFYNR